MSRQDEDGNFVYTCVNCDREVNAVFYVGLDNDEPAWCCDMCVMNYRKPR